MGKLSPQTGNVANWVGGIRGKAETPRIVLEKGFREGDLWQGGGRIGIGKDCSYYL